MSKEITPKGELTRRRLLKAIGAGGALGALAMASGDRTILRNSIAAAPVAGSQGNSIDSGFGTGGSKAFYVFTDGTYTYAMAGLKAWLKNSIAVGSLVYGGPLNLGSVSGTHPSAVIQACINAAYGSIEIVDGTYADTTNVTNASNIPILISSLVTFSGFTVALGSGIPWLALGGKPFVTVTPNGPFDGGDFGPNTFNTTTAGIQEALAKKLPIMITSGNYPAFTADLLLQNSNTILIGVGSEQVNLNLNTHQITNSNLPLNYLKLGGFAITNGVLNLGTGIQPTAYPLMNNYLVIDDLPITNNITGATWNSSSMIRYWQEVYLHRFFKDDIGIPSLTTDSLGIGGNIKLKWDVGHVIARDNGGAGVNWQGDSITQSTQNALGAHLLPSAPTNLTNINYEISNVDVVGDLLAHSIYPPFDSITFRKCNHWCTNNTSTLSATDYIQYAGTDFAKIRYIDSVIYQGNGAVVPLAITSIPECHVELLNTDLVTKSTSTFNSSGIQLIGTGPSTTVDMIGGHLFDWSTSYGASLFRFFNGSTNGSFHPRGVKVISETGYLDIYDVALCEFYAGSPAPLQRIIGDIEVLANVSALTGNWKVGTMQGGAGLSLAKGSVMDLNVNSRKFKANLFSLPSSADYQFGISTGQYPTFLADYGFALTTPALPAAIGSADNVTNIFPFTVRVYQSETSITSNGTHIIDPLGNDTTLPDDPIEFDLDSGASVYYATAVPTSWKWYGT